MRLYSITPAFPNSLNPHSHKNCENFCFKKVARSMVATTSNYSTDHNEELNIEIYPKTTAGAPGIKRYQPIFERCFTWN
jgi:hypothetical protein